jgi:hypothetical protein
MWSCRGEFLRVSSGSRLILAVLVIAAACGNGPDTIREASDLPRLAESFKMELQQNGFKPRCGTAGLQKVEAFLDSLPEPEQQAHIIRVGAYLGECMRGTYGGEWVEDPPGKWAVKFPEGNMAYPIGSVERFVKDPFDSFVTDFEELPTVFGWEEKEEVPRDYPRQPDNRQLTTDN